MLMPSILWKKLRADSHELSFYTYATPMPVSYTHLRRLYQGTPLMDSRNPKGCWERICPVSYTHLIGDDCLIENVGNFINNYTIGDDCYKMCIRDRSMSGVPWYNLRVCGWHLRVWCHWCRSNRRSSGRSMHKTLLHQEKLLVSKSNARFWFSITL